MKKYFNVDGGGVGTGDYFDGGSGNSDSVCCSIS